MVPDVCVVSVIFDCARAKTCSCLSLISTTIIYTGVPPVDRCSKNSSYGAAATSSLGLSGMNESRHVRVVSSSQLLHPF